MNAVELNFAFINREFTINSPVYLPADNLVGNVIGYRRSGPLSFQVAVRVVELNALRIEDQRVIYCETSSLNRL